LDFSINISNLKKWIIDNFLLAFVGFLLLATIIVVVATFLSYFTLLPFVYYSDQKYTLINMTSFVNQNSSNFVSIFVNTMLTLGLIIFSALSLSSAQDTLKQSEKQQKQFQDEQKIRDIEKRLEFFYIPAQTILKIAEEYLNDPNNFAKSIAIRKFKRGDELLSTTHEERAIIFTVENLKEIDQYRFLAKEKTCRSLIKYIYEGENNENRLEFSKNIQKDVTYYLAKLYELKQEN
jgi:hypothetical protein